MESIKKFLANKRIGWYLSAAALILGLISVIVYAARGGNRYADVSGAAVGIIVVAIITNAIVLVRDFKLAAFMPFIFYTIGFAILLNTEMLFFSNVLVAIDGNRLDPAWICFMITEILAMLFSGVGFAMGLSKKDKLLAE